ncbi:MAG: C25 family cysteine peptidase [Planctomycetota bacterium]
MKRSVTFTGLAVVALSLALPSALAGPAQRTDGRSKTLDLVLTFTPADLTKGAWGDYDVLRLARGSLLIKEGEPVVPMRIVSLALPVGYVALSAEIEFGEAYYEVGDVRLRPGSKPLPVSLGGQEVLAEGGIYQTDAFYPGNSGALLGTARKSGYPIAGVVVYPVQYNPVQRIARVYEQVTLRVQAVPVAPVERIRVRSADVESALHSAVTRLVDNPHDVPPAAADVVVGRARAGSPDLVSYLIIASPSVAGEFAALEEWKLKRGVATELVTTDWVYANYPGEQMHDAPDKIRHCIKDYWLNKGLLYVLLAGDAEIMPWRPAYACGHSNGHDIPADLYYSDLDGTWNEDGDTTFGEINQDQIDMYSDVCVGRAPVEDATEAARFVQKVMQYEAAASEQPLPGDYQVKLLFLASRLDGVTDEAVLKDVIDVESVPAEYDITKLYERDGNLSPSSAIDAMNGGMNVINHAGHGSEGAIQAGTGYLSGYDLWNLTNDPRFSAVFWSLSCYSANFPYDDTIAEQFVNSPGGGGFYIGNSHYGWYYVGNPAEGVSAGYDRYFFAALYDLLHFNWPLGLVFSIGRDSGAWKATYDEYERYCHYEQNLLGDPELPIYRFSPLPLVVTHPDTLPAGYSEFTVHVEDEYGGIYGDAIVTLWKDGEVYLVTDTETYGDATFGVVPRTAGTLEVTAAKYGHLPAQGTATVVEGALTADNYTLSEGAGGVVNFHLDAGAAFAGRDYVVLGSMSGTEPGLPVGNGVTLPLNWDLFMLVVATNLNSPIFDHFLGELDASGEASARLSVPGPMPPGCAGLVLHFAFGVMTPWEYASNPVGVLIEE